PAPLDSLETTRQESIALSIPAMAPSEDAMRRIVKLQSGPPTDNTLREYRCSDHPHLHCWSVQQGRSRPECASCLRRRQSTRERRIGAFRSTPHPFLAHVVSATV